MASSWGNSFLNAWGNSWGATTPVEATENTGGLGSFEDKIHKQNIEDEYVLELVFKKFIEVINE